MRLKHSPKHPARTRSSAPSEKPMCASSIEDIRDEYDHVPRLGLIDSYSVFAPLIPTTILSSLLVGGSHWTIPQNIQKVINGNQGSTQLVVQVIAATLGVLHVMVICTLINYFTRLRLASRTNTSLNALLFWHSLLSKQVDFGLPLHFLLLLIAFFGISTIPGALWAGAITPIHTSRYGSELVKIPSYSNISGINAAFTDEILPSMVTVKGRFSFGPGEILLGPLLNSAATATTIDASIRQHPKLDHSRFTYYGRSYGIGASVGLKDDHLLLDPVVTQYTFQESGYLPITSCIYNSSSAFGFIRDDVDAPGDLISIAYGCLPNVGAACKDHFTWQRYPGYSTNVSVAIATAQNPEYYPRMLGIAAGNNYTNLNSTQCVIDFRPTRFTVAVDTRDRKITVTPLTNNSPEEKEEEDIEPTGFLSWAALYQIEEISRDQASLWSSLVGNSLNASIESYAMSMEATGVPRNATEASLIGLRNSIDAMVDDLIVAFGSAQILLAEESNVVPAHVVFDATRLGEARYIYIIVVLNTVIFLIVVAEAIRTDGWHGLTDFNYMDPRKLVIGSSRGGRELAEIVDEVTAETQGDRAATIWDKSISPRVGDLNIKQEGQRIVIGKKVLRE